MSIAKHGRVLLLIARRNAIMDQLDHLRSMGAFENKNIFTTEWVKRIANLSGVTCYSTIVNIMTSYVVCFEASINVPFQSEINMIINQCDCENCNPTKQCPPHDYVFLRRLVLKNRRRDDTNLHRKAMINSHQQRLSRRLSQRCYSAMETLVSVLMIENRLENLLDEQIESMC